MANRGKRKNKPGAGRPVSKNPRSCNLGGVRLTEDELEFLRDAWVYDEEFGSTFSEWVRETLLSRAEAVEPQ